jgi:DNA mismatch endonuclease (patch repair protein)
MTELLRRSEKFAGEDRFSETPVSKSASDPEALAEERSRIMRAVKGSNTRPERMIRRLLHRRGLRFRLGGCGLPGKPDIVLPRWRVAVFVHGCFWHGHDCARGDRIPKTNRDYWIKKIQRNKARDGRVHQELQSLDWRVLIIWECDLQKAEALGKKLSETFGITGA